MEYQSLKLFNYDNIYLATKSNYYKLNSSLVSKLTENLLLRNSLLNQEIETIFPKSEINIVDSKFDQESNSLFDKCLEYSIDHEFIMKVLWHRIYDEPIVMKFISMRHSNYANNLFFNQHNSENRTDKNRIINNGFLLNDNIPVFPLI